MVALATSFHPVGCLVLWAHLVFSCLLFSSLAISFFSYWRVRLRDRDRGRGSSTACLLAALRPPLFLSSSFFIWQASSSLALIAPSSLDLRCSRLAPTLCSIALGSRSSDSPASVRGPCFRLVLLHSGCGTFAFGLCFRLGSRSPASRTLFSARAREGLSRDFVSWLVACLRCSVCHVPSLLGLSRAFVARLVACPCFHRRLPSFSAFAFVARLVACLRFRS